MSTFKPGPWVSDINGVHWHSIPPGCGDKGARRLVVLDPEDREQVERLSDLLVTEGIGRGGVPDAIASNLGVQRALREFANPTPPRPDEPTNPKARVTDRRENVWRLLADGDWVCTSGPDCGEYLVWWQLAERGPLTIEGVTQ